MQASGPVLSGCPGPVSCLSSKLAVVGVCRSCNRALPSRPGCVWSGPRWSRATLGAVVPAPGAGGGWHPAPVLAPRASPGCTLCLPPWHVALVWELDNGRSPVRRPRAQRGGHARSEREPGAGARGGERTGAREGDGNGAPGQHRGDAEAGDGRQRGPVHLRR